MHILAACYSRSGRIYKNTMSIQCSPPVVLDANTQEAIRTSKLLVIGAGGIGCEILKNLALSGFTDIEIIDLDTIDVSNLNRQFLFRKEHVGKSKAKVARETILNYNSAIRIVAHHDSITEIKYGVNYFKQFNIVLNALDNRAARNHVNRMCLAADVPLIESGTAGYSGQVEFIKKGMTQCYECQPKPAQKSFPGCTIRNTPSEPVHCIVWAKHLFNQLFGEEDPDQDVSPDTADPEAAGDAAESAMSKDTQNGNIQRTSTRQWALSIGYDAAKLFNKFFRDDIKYLLTMENLWKTRKAPEPLAWTEASIRDKQGDDVSNVWSDMQVWPLYKCVEIFAESIAQLKSELDGKDCLIWDKDDKTAMDFVCACANIRCCAFSIPPKSRFDTKSIAGNIIPAIASTNAMVAGLVVLKAMRVLAHRMDDCQSIYVRQKSHVSNTLLMADRVLDPPNPKCYVCAPKPFVNLFLNIAAMTVRELEEDVLKKCLNMIAPDVMDMTRNTLMISSEEGETAHNNDKKLCDVHLTDGSMLKVDDFMQNYELTICLNQWEAAEKDEPLFKISTDAELKAKKDDDAKNGTTINGDETSTPPMDDDDHLTIVETITDDYDPQEGTSKRRKLDTPPEDDDCVIMDDDDDD